MALGIEGRDLTFSAGVTEGLDAKGMENYLEALKADLLVEVGKTLDDTSTMESTINAGWQGISRDKFFEQFNSAIEKTKEDLAAEYADLVNKLSELAQSYYAQDTNMITD